MFKRLKRITTVPALVAVTMFLLATSLVETFTRTSLSSVVETRFGYNITLVAIAMFLGSLFIGLQYVVRLRPIKPLQYAIAMLPLMLYVASLSVYVLLYSVVKSTGILYFMLLGFLFFEPLINRD